MSLKVAIQMDPVEALDPDVDTTVMMALSAQARGHKLWWYPTSSLALENGRLTARARTLEVRPV